jgi:nucleoside-diphosphate-sugar epimerase
VSRVVVIGATGHVGTYLVPRLVRAGWDVVALSRGEREPYEPAPEWRAVERVTADRESEDAAGSFGDRVAALGADAVIDMICFPPSRRASSSTRCARAGRCSCTAARSGSTARRRACR